MSSTVRIKYAELKTTIHSILFSIGCTKEDSELLSKVLTDSSCDGFQSHGINRLPLLIKYIEDGHVRVDEDMMLVKDGKNIKQFDGNLGLGIKNAHLSTIEAMELAKNNSLGIATLKNTNHWLRGGTYGWMAAENGYILLCWTNTTPNLPPYGCSENLVGNNPLVIAIPRKNEKHIVLDMSMSQYSYGKVASYARLDKKLPTVGGFDENGVLTDDAKEIREGGRHLPIGFWKGSSLAFVLDMLAAILSGGITTNGINGYGGVDKGMSQVFVAINPNDFSDETFQKNLIDNTLEIFNDHNRSENCDIRYPGEQTLIRRKENHKLGIPIEKEVWEKVLSLVSN